MMLVKVLKPIRNYKIGTFNILVKKHARIVEERTLKEFKKFVKDWKTKPVFESYRRIVNYEAQVVVFTYDPIFKYVDLGTRPHMIRPKSPDGILRFEVDGEVVFSTYAQHPGFKGRNYTKQVKKIMKPIWYKEMKLAIEEWRRRTS